MIFLIIIIIVCHYHLISLSFVIIIIYQFHQISMLTFCICRCTGDPAFLLGGIWPKIIFMPLVFKALCILHPEAAIPVQIRREVYLPDRSVSTQALPVMSTVGWLALQPEIRHKLWRYSGPGPIFGLACFTPRLTGSVGSVVLFCVLRVSHCALRRGMASILLCRIGWTQGSLAAQRRSRIPLGVLCTCLCCGWMICLTKVLYRWE